MSAFKCPKCGATPDKHGKGECEQGVNGSRDCGGFICECEGDGGAKHGESVNDPCHNARCFHCRWAGTVPMEKAEDPLKLLKEMLKYIDDRRVTEPKALIQRIRKRLKQK